MTDENNSDDSIQDVVKTEEVEIISEEADLSELDYKEKTIILFGLIALLGDGEVSNEEISAIRNYIIETNLDFESVAHLDPNDQELTADETLLWVLDKIKNYFADTVDLTEKEIIEVFKEFSKSLWLDIKKNYKNKALDEGAPNKPKDYMKSVDKILLETAKIDGELSKLEKKLVKVFRRSYNKKYILYRILIYSLGVSIAVAIFAGE